MNLVAIQEKLKDFPNQTIMAYANGQNPEVPAYMALAELQRRKRMQQGSKEMPKETVKDRIERESVQQTMPSMEAQQPQQVAQQAPEQTPQQPPQQEMPAMAAGGITRLPVGEMFNYRDGGIVAFSDGDFVIDPMIGTTQSTTASDDDRTIFEKLGLGNRENRRVLEASEAATRKRKETANKPPPEEPVQGAQPAPQPTARPAARPAAPRQAGGVNALPRRDLAMDLLKKSQEMTTQQPEVPETYDVAMERARKANPLLKKPIGEDYQKKLGELSEFDKEARGKFGERETARSKRDFFDSLIAAGEATRGGGGIGSLLGGYGRASSAAKNAADERAARQEALQREQDLNMAKLNSEIENLRRAEAIGDVKSQQESLTKIADIKNTMKQNQMTLQANTAQTAAMMRGQDLQAKTSREQTAAYRKNELFDIAERLRPQFPKLSEEQLLEKALKFTRAGVGAESKLDAATEARLKQLDVKRLLNAQVYASDPKKLAAANKPLNDEEARIRGGAGGSGGGVRFKLDANGRPIQ